ncbi:MAG: hypothetical protein R6X17_06795 [Candidatus Competibacteraceae bacterium]
MPSKRYFATMLLALGLSAGLTVWAVAQTTGTGAKTAAVEADQKEMPFPDGENWPTATEREKLAYLLGIMNMALVEYQLHGPDPKYRTTVSNLVKATDGMTLREIMETINAFYQSNPDLQRRPVIEVIWFELVEPRIGAQSDKPAASKAK